MFVFEEYITFLKPLKSIWHVWTTCLMIWSVIERTSRPVYERVTKAFILFWSLVLQFQTVLWTKPPSIPMSTDRDESSPYLISLSVSSLSHLFAHLIKRSPASSGKKERRDNDMMRWDTGQMEGPRVCNLRVAHFLFITTYVHTDSN